MEVDDLKNQLDKPNTSALLSLVATPIGNLEDISFRALRTLQESDFIAAEDTRHSGMLLKHFEIKKPMISYREHNQNSAGERILSLLREGKRVSLISDAGLPGISDPGIHLVRLAIENQIPYTVIPGASAGITALVYSGLPTERFVFEGFVPVKGSLRKEQLQKIAQETRTVILYEAPHRIRKTLADLLKHCEPTRGLVIVRELTKIYEEALHGTLEELYEQIEKQEIKGELVLLLEGAKVTLETVPNEEGLLFQLEQLYQQGKSKKEAVDLIAKRYGIRRQELYLLKKP
jgi:16S rRNA (cytidine1402-2'-O)-methyltransferase